MDVVKLCIGVATVLLSIFGHLPYIRDIVKNKTKPHAYTWFVLSVLTGLVFVAQVQQDAGFGAWTTGTTTVMSLIIFGFSIKKGTRDITAADTITFLAALVALGVWIFTKQPLVSVILATAIEALAFVPTIRKTLQRPEQETFTTFSLAVLRNGLALTIMSSYSVVTVLFPASLVVMNAIMSVLLLAKAKRHPSVLR